MNGFVLPPVIIMPGKRRMIDWYNETELPDRYMILTFDSRYTTDELAFHYFHHFDRFTSRRTQGKYRLLLMDNHGSHLTVEFLQYCQDRSILVFPFPAHLTHLLQPLDSFPFQVYKKNQRELVNRATTGGLDYDKVEFLADLKELREKTFRCSVICSGWREVGLLPWNPKSVINKLRDRSTTPELAIFDGDQVLDNFNSSVDNIESRERQSRETPTPDNPPPTV
jgi:DDE superfamily endonuclease